MSTVDGTAIPLRVGLRPGGLSPGSVNALCHSSEIIKNARDVSKDCHDTMEQSHRIMENVSNLLCNLYRSIPAAELSKRIAKAFREHDTNSDGTMNRSELRGALGECGHTPTDEEMQIIFREVDMDNNGVVDKLEFEHLVRESLSLDFHTCPCPRCVAKCHVKDEVVKATKSR